MTLLVVSPDYASHLLPLATQATAWRDAGERVVVATGPATAPIVQAFGYERVELRLGRGSNPGVIRADEQPHGEDDRLRAFFAATRLGMVETLRFQAEARRLDLLWEPVTSGRRVLEIIDVVRPDRILVDHLAFGAVLALQASGVPYDDMVLGHPTALPVDDEVYGNLVAWPRCFAPSADELADLRASCEQVRDGFTAEWNDALAALDPGASAVDDAFAVHGQRVLFNYPSELEDPQRLTQIRADVPQHVHLGSSVRDDPSPPDVARWLERLGSRPMVYVSFGSFLSARHDVLATVAAGLAMLPDVTVAMATGSCDREALGDVPENWLVRPVLPQVACLARAAAAVNHGGNNSVTETLHHGVPMVVLPFSTDQFAGAAAVERHRSAVALDPNRATANELAAAVEVVLEGEPRERAAALGTRIRSAAAAVRLREAGARQ